MVATQYYLLQLCSDENADVLSMQPALRDGRRAQFDLVAQGIRVMEVSPVASRLAPHRHVYTAATPLAYKSICTSQYTFKHTHTNTSIHSTSAF